MWWLPWRDTVAKRPAMSKRRTQHSHLHIQRKHSRARTHAHVHGATQPAVEIMLEIEVPKGTEDSLDWMWVVVEDEGEREEG